MFFSSVARDEKPNKDIIQSSDLYSTTNQISSETFLTKHSPSRGQEVNSISSKNYSQTSSELLNHQSIKNIALNQTDHLNASSKQQNSIKYVKTVFLMPHVPQCKANTSSDDEDYDDI